MTKARDLADRTSADLTAVTAGTGISITSGAGPIPTVTNTVATGFDAKGDLIVGTGADTFSKLTVASTANWTLVVDSAEATGLKWAAPAASGGMTLINTGGTTLSGSSVTISSIPSGYVHLYGEIVGFRPATNAADLRVQFNNDTNSVYSWIGSSTFNQTSTKFTDGGCNSSSSNGNIQFQIPSYTRTLWKFAEVNSHNVLSTGTSSFFAQNYISVSSITGAITDITFLCSSGNFTSGTVFLYGVK